RRGEQHVEGLDLRVEPELLELRQHPLGVVFVVGRADVMWVRAQPLHGVAQVFWIGQTTKLRLPFALGGGVRRRVAVHVGGGCSGRIGSAAGLQQRKDESSNTKTARHRIGLLEKVHRRMQREFCKVAGLYLTPTLAQCASLVADED